MPHLVVPHEFFIKERRQLYRDFTTALWRELLQNSVDAGARAIAVSLRPLAGGDVRITFADDGRGMDRRTLEEVFFRLGASTKGQGDIGGFGRARLLTCFSMRRYAIRTHDLEVEGCGASYELLSGLPPQAGCRFEIDVPGGETSPEALRDALMRVLSMSQPAARVTVDGVAFEGWLRKGRTIRTLDLPGAGKAFASVHLSRSGPFVGRIIVRVAGAYMFAEPTRARAQLVVELDPALSRQAMTASRDALRGPFAEAFSAWREELAVDTRSAVRDRRGETTRMVPGGGVLTASRSRPRPVPAPAAPGATAPDAVPVTGWRTKALLPHELPDIAIIDDATSAAMRRAVREWSPQSWDDPGSLVQGRGRGARGFALLHAWRVACAASLQSLLDLRGAEIGESIAWTVGFCFGEAEAKHQRMGEVHVLAVNPVDAEGRARFRLGRSSDLRQILALARHEVAHVVHSWHDEAYASLLTDIDGATDDAPVLAAMRMSVHPARAWTPRRAAA